MSATVQNAGYSHPPFGALNTQPLLGGECRIAEGAGQSDGFEELRRARQREHEVLE
jgi:hypothetical protein